jgi:hypothetical protein
MTYTNGLLWAAGVITAIVIARVVFHIHIW